MVNSCRWSLLVVVPIAAKTVGSRARTVAASVLGLMGGGGVLLGVLNLSNMFVAEVGLGTRSRVWGRASHNSIVNRGKVIRESS